MNSEKKNLVVFGYGLAIIFAIVAYKVWHDYGWNYVHIVHSICILMLAIFTTLHYKSLRLLYNLWMKGAHFIGNFITNVVLSILFYVVFGIAGIMLRLLKKDLLDCQLDYSPDSYWIKKEEVVFEQDHYKRQF